ncbi:CAAX prenyl protease-related protein [Pseudoduganella danionis]|uniref:CAAX prenyl protease-related protein n=1 Tax=Pseudoduganella danionis TaxID=1890295 RepID=UPI0035B06A75
MVKRATLARTLPFLAYIAFIFIADMLSRLGVGEASLRYLYPVKIGVVLLLLMFYWRDYDELRVKIGWRLQPLVWGVGLLVFVLWISLDAGWMLLGQSSGYDPHVDGQLHWPLVLIRLAGAALVVPIMEELFWRSFLMRWLVAEDFRSVAPDRLSLRSFVITVILFGVEHNLWLAGMVAGLAYALLYWRTSNLWTSIIAHGVTNGVLGIWVIYTSSWTYW